MSRPPAMSEGRAFVVFVLCVAAGAFVGALSVPGWWPLWGRTLWCAASIEIGTLSGLLVMRRAHRRRQGTLPPPLRAPDSR